jgi:Protein of unknown function (DUF2811)
MTVTVSILAELPESLHESLTRYLETHPNSDQDQVLIAALSFFLMNNTETDYPVARTYFETLLQRAS